MSNRNIIFLVIFAILIIAPVPTTALSEPQKDFMISSGESWLTGFTYRKMHNITGSSGAGADYQVMIIADYGEGSDSGDTVYLDGLCQTDFDDIRFTDDDGITALYYWRESYTDSDTATFWIRVADTLSEDATIYIYYGHETANTTSNGKLTFDMFSDYSRYADDEWTRYDSGEIYVMADDAETVGSFSTTGKGEGMAYDGTYYYLATFDTTTQTSWLYQFDNDLEIIDSIEITDGSLTHSGGMCLYDGVLYVAMAEPNAVQTYPSKIKRYHASTLTYINTVVDSSEFNNDHWGGVVIVEELDRMYIANWDTEELYVFQIDGTYVTTIESPPDSMIQDFVYIEEDGLIYGSKQEGDYNNISVWKPEGIGNSLTKVGDVLTEDDRTYNGFTWYDDYFYSSGTSPNDDITKMYGSDLNLTIESTYIYNNDDIGPDLMIEARVNMGGNRKFNFGFVEELDESGDEAMLHNSDGNINFYDDTGDHDTGFDLDQDTWTTLSLGWEEDKANVYKNRGSEYTRTAIGGITGVAQKTKLQLWGSADAYLYCQWIFVRNWQRLEPEHDTWGSVELIGLPTWEIDVVLIFLGLIMIPASTMFLVKGGKDEMSTDKLFYFLIAFLIGWGLFIGGIM